MKKVRSLLAMALAVVMCMMVAAVPAFAAEADPNLEGQPVTLTAENSGGGNGDDGIMPLGTSWISVGNSYVDVARNDSGINGDVHLSIDQEGYNGFEYSWEIIMINTSGIVVHQAGDVVGFGTGGTWWAGADVARVQLRIVPRYPWISPKTFTVKATY